MKDIVVNKEVERQEH